MKCVSDNYTMLYRNAYMHAYTLTRCGKPRKSVGDRLIAVGHGLMTVRRL